MTRSGPSPALLVLAYLGFVSLGLPDALLGVAWPSLRDTFGLPQAVLGLILAVPALSYFVSGMFAGRLIERLGIGLLLAGSTALVTAGVFGFSFAPALALLLPAALVIGLGSGAIDAALNTYAARNFRPRHLTWLHAAYSLGAMTGPVIMTAVLSRGTTWRMGYAIVGAMLAVLAVAFVFARRRWETPKGPVLHDTPAGDGPVPARQSGFAVLRDARVRLQVAIFFLYTGLEIAAGQWSYTLLTESRGLGHTAAGTWVAAYWGGILAGRLALGFVVERVGQVRLLRLSTAGALLFAALFALPFGWTAVALPLLSFSLAGIYPGLMAETPRRVGEHAAPHAVGFQVSAATAGVAVVPSLGGLVGEQLGLGAIPLLVAACAAAVLLLHERLVALADRARS